MCSELPHGQAAPREPGDGQGGQGGLLAQDSLPRPRLQKIMHTRKRHQDMFQDLNRKLQHAAEKDKEVLGPDSKV